MRSISRQMRTENCTLRTENSVRAGVVLRRSRRIAAPKALTRLNGYEV